MVVSTSGMSEIRGIDIQKLAVGFADEENVLKKFVTNSSTTAREIRWYQKTTGFLDTPTTNDTSISLMYNTSKFARPAISEQSWTRMTSYIKTFMVESPLISDSDIKDSDPDVWGNNVRDLVRAVERKVDLRIFSQLFNCLEATPTQPLTNGAVTVQTTAATAVWSATATMDPITDILNGKQKIRSYGYDPEGSILGMNSVEHKLLLTWLINTKGSSIPQFSTQAVQSGVVMELLGCNVVVSENFTTDWVYQFVPQRAATWKSFTPITTAVIEEPLIGKKIRILEEGECLLTDPKAVHVISNTV
jgi:hypothetical protein